MPETFLYNSTVTMAQAADLIRAASSFVITSHAKPDGDAVGSALALRRALAGLGKSAEVVLAGPIERSLRTLIGDEPIRLDAPPSRSDVDLVLVVDTGSWNQLAPMRSWLEPLRDRMLVIDHHARGDDLAGARYIDATAASTTAILIDLFDELGVDLATGAQRSVAEALFIGLATDTGWFRHSNADARAFGQAARLLRTGVNRNRLYQVLEESYTPKRLALEAFALSTIQYVRRETAAIMTLAPGDFDRLGASMEDLTGIVNLPMAIGAVRMAVLIAQDRDDQPVKLSFRSKPATGESGEVVIDVNDLAQQFDGGGHKHAAGARIHSDLDTARQRVIDAIESI